MVEAATAGAATEATEAVMVEEATVAGLAVARWWRWR